jgi:hypothetical protein
MQNRYCETKKKELIFMENDGRRLRYDIELEFGCSGKKGCDQFL